MEKDKEKEDVVEETPTKPTSTKTTRTKKPLKDLNALLDSSSTPETKEESKDNDDSTKNVVETESKETPKVEESKPIEKEVVIPQAPVVPVNDSRLVGVKDLIEDKEKIDKRNNDDIIEIRRYQPSPEIGLLDKEVKDRTYVGLVNKVKSKTLVNIPLIIFKNLFSVVNIVVYIIAIWLMISGLKTHLIMSGDEVISTIELPITNLSFFYIIILNSVVGIIQEVKAKKTIAKLALLSAPMSTVLRDKVEEEISIDEIVIDDILVLTSGKQIPVDAVVVDGSVEVNESLLTGESDAILKKIGDKLFSGSYIVSGRCKAFVTAISKDVYINTITNSAKKYKKPKSNLLGSLRLIIMFATLAMIPLGIFLFQSIVSHNKNMNGVNFSSFTLFENLFDYNIVVKVAGAMVGMIPSGLFLLTSVALMVGVLKLARNNTLVQELYCIEMLARVDTLCLDKTGTITDGTMRVKNIFPYKNSGNYKLDIMIPAMINALEDDNMTSKALINRFGLAKKIRHINLIPFSSQRKYSAVQFDKIGTFVLGAPEFVLKDKYHLVEKDVEAQTSDGYRVICLAKISGNIENNAISGTTEVIGLVVIEDTIRPDAQSTIEYFINSKVDVIVISGDSPLTVSKIASRAGILNADRFISLDGMPDKEVVKVADKYNVFGRVSPKQKQILVKTLKSLGRTVAMTGDGVNDILALREADTSIAMASGSEAARNVSHLVLQDSNFSHMPMVVGEGRRVINNVQKVAALFLTKTIFSLILSIIGIILGDYPIEPRQLLLVEFFVIGFPSFFIALEPNNNQATGHFFINTVFKALPGAIVVSLNSLIIFFLESSYGLSKLSLQTLIILSTTYTCLFVLYRISQPFNNRRLVLWGSMFFLCTLIFIIGPMFLGIMPFFSTSWYDVKPLNIYEIVLFFMLFLLSLPMMNTIASVPTILNKSIHNLLKSISK